VIIAVLLDVDKTRRCQCPPILPCIIRAASAQRATGICTKSIARLVQPWRQFCSHATFVADLPTPVRKDAELSAQVNLHKMAADHCSQAAKDVAICASITIRLGDAFSIGFPTLPHAGYIIIADCDSRVMRCCRTHVGVLQRFSSPQDLRIFRCGC
jgi:hypothetical protein